MALSTRQQSDSGLYLTEPELEYNILTYLSLSDLHSSRQVSHAWHQMMRQLPWDEIFNRDPERQAYFISILINAIQKEDYEQMHYWIERGAESKLDFNQPSPAYVRVEFPWGVMASAHFKEPTVLAVAANLLSGKSGARIIKLLLNNNADPSLKAKYTGVESIGDEFSVILPLDEKKLPLQLARDNGIKAIFHLHRLEQELSAPTMQAGVIFQQIKTSSNQRFHLTLEYINRLLQQQGVEFQIQGISRTLTSADKAKLINIPSFGALHRSISPSFFWDHRYSFLAGGAGIFYSVCFSRPAILLGKYILGLLTTATTGTLIPLLLGSIIIGLTVGILYDLLKKSWGQHFHVTLKDLEKPIQKQQKQLPCQLRGGLFFKSNEMKPANQIDGYGTKLHSGAVQLRSLNPSATEQQGGIRSNSVFYSH